MTAAHRQDLSPRSGSYAGSVMNPRRRISVALFLVVSLAMTVTVGPALTQVPPDRIAPLMERVASVFSGTDAYETVAFVEQYWRIPGNTGYDAAIDRVTGTLRSAGYLPENEAGDHPFVYRIETRPLGRPAWDPLDAELSLVGEDGPLVRYITNRNLMAANSWSTPPEGVEAPLVYVGSGRAADWEGQAVAGAIVFGETSVGRLYSEAVQRRGAVGVLSFRLPDFNRPDDHPDSIPFSSIPYDETGKAWGLCLSPRAAGHLKEALAEGPVRVRVRIRSRFIPEAVERTLVAEVRGSQMPRERVVFSAHVQEPGANDNASGVAVQAEMARTAAALVAGGLPLPSRTITFLWGDEIAATRRFMESDPAVRGEVRWGISLDMVGEDTAKTGGTFLVEKLPDPSSVWTRGSDHHTEWGGRPLREEDLFPHWLNDFVLNRCRERAVRAGGWVVGSNPYEGGSDHVPFLRAGVPSLLLWHFTDVYYHTDGDRLDKVSVETMTNVGISALTVALALASGDESLARQVAVETEQAARARLETEATLSRQAVEEGADLEEQVHIVEVWAAWYAEAVRRAVDIELGGPSPAVEALLEETAGRITAYGHDLAASIHP